MKSKGNKIRSIRNMRELELMQRNLENQRLLSEKKLLGASAKIVDSFTDSLKEWMFEFGASMVFRLLNAKKHKKERTKNQP